LGEEYLTDPYPIAAALARTTPVFFDERLGHIVLTRRSDLDAVFTDDATFASTNVQDPIAPLCAEATEILAAEDFDPVAVMSNRPEPDHGRIRVHTAAAFSNRRLSLLEPWIRRRCHELVDSMHATSGPVEIVAALAFPLPGETVFRLIGFPPEDDDQLKSWCGGRKLFSWGMPRPDEQVRIAQQMLDYWRYCREFVAERRHHPRDDLTSELLAAHRTDPEALCYREVESVIYGLSFAGHEAVTSLLCNALLCLLGRHTDQGRAPWEAIVADPSRIPAAVEEVLRFESSQISWRRITTGPATVGGVAIPARMPLLLNFASANREPGRFADPDRFDIDRSDARGHISFGKGVHYCLGAKLARLEARVVLEVLAERIPSLALVEDQELAWSPNITFRGPRELRVGWDPT